MKKYFILSATLLFLWLTIMAKPPVGSMSACAGKLQKMYNIEQSYIKELLEADKTWYLKYKMTTTISNPYLNGKTETVSTVGEIWARKNMRYVNTNELEMYVDDRDIFTINKSKHSIMRTRSSREILNSAGRVFKDVLSDSLKNLYKLASCQQIVEAGGEKIIKYDLIPIDKKKALVTLVTYYFVEETNILKKVYIENNPTLTTGVKDYWFEVLERGEKQMDNQMYPVRNKLLTTNGHLKPQYTHYRYIDLYNKPKK